MATDTTSANARLLVAIPCLNEAATVSNVIKGVPRAIPGIAVIDILVVDDGSSDNTGEVAAAAGAVVISHARNFGVGRAFQTAVNHAVEHDYDVLVNIDADGQFNPSDIPKLVEPLVQRKAEMITASRFIDSDKTPDMPKVKLIGNHMMSYLISRMIRARFYDVSCGFRCYSREALLQLNLHGAFTYTQETFLDLAVKRLAILEVPIDVLYFPDRKSRVASSIATYAVNTAKIIFRGYRDYFPLRFFWGIALLFAVPGIVFALLFFGHYLATGLFSGFLFAAFLSAFCISMSMVFFVLGIVADMLDRIRSNQERILTHLKRWPGRRAE